MRVSLNAQLLSSSRSYRSGGISRVIFHLLRELQYAEGGHHFYAFVPGAPADAALASTNTLTIRDTGLPTERPLVRVFWEQAIQPLELARLGAHLHHSLSFALPLAWAGPTVLSVYDLSFLRHPRLFHRGNRIYKTFLTRISARRASMVVTISEHGKREAIALLGLAEEKVAVAYPGVDNHFRPLAERDIREFRDRLGLPQHFVLFLGTLEPRKNVAGLVRAYSVLRRRVALPHKLVLAGGEGWLSSPLFRLIQELGLQDDVLFPGFVDPADQVLWYNAADAFVYPSLYEGFGLPPLEAMACGVPVVASNRAALPEVVGEAGRLVDPDDPEKLAETLVEVLSDEALRAGMKIAGLERATKFTWAGMARRILGVYHETLFAGRA